MKNNKGQFKKGEHCSPKTEFKKGQILSKEIIQKLKENNARYWKGKVFSDKHKENLRLSHLGHKPSEITKKKMRCKKLTEEHKQKIREKLKGNKNSLGYKHSKETGIKRSESITGNKHWNWQGGKSFEPYSIDWTKTLKRSIRERDKYTCQLCGELQSGIAFDVHHIDYDKQNCNPNNLITLCRSCNSKVNKNRDFWTKKFRGDRYSA